MARTVWKYVLTPEAATEIQGVDPRVVHVGIDPLWVDRPEMLQANVPTVWVELDPSVERDSLHLVFVGTGHSIPWGDAVHVGSCITPGGLVWHVYDVDRKVRELRG